MLPVILLGGIYSRRVTPTEAAAVAAAYALMLAFCGLSRAGLPPGDRRLRRMPRARPAIVAITIAGALVMNWVVAAEQIPDEIGAWIAVADMSSRSCFLLIVNVLFLVLGCFLDTLLMLLIIVPIADADGHRRSASTRCISASSTIVNMMIGLVTPPMGELLFLITGVSGISLTSMYREIWPFLIVLIALLFIMLVYVPNVVLWLPIQFGYMPGR